MRNVTDSTDEPLPFPDVVRQFEGAGCRLLGRLHDDQAPATPSAGSPSRPPLAVLTTREGDAFVSVDTVAAQPLVRLRTLLADGTLVETIQRDRVPPRQPDPDQPPGLDATRSSRGRVVDLSPFWDAHESLRRHRALVAAQAPGTGVPCDDLELAHGLYAAAAAHDRAIDAHGLRLVTWTRPSSLTTLLVGVRRLRPAFALQSDL